MGSATSFLTIPPQRPFFFFFYFLNLFTFYFSGLFNCFQRRHRWMILSSSSNHSNPHWRQKNLELKTGTFFSFFLFLFFFLRKIVLLRRTFFPFSCCCCCCYPTLVHSLAVGVPVQLNVEHWTIIGNKRRFMAINSQQELQRSNQSRRSLANTNYN